MRPASTLKALLWPKGPSCPHCGVVNEATALKGKSTPPRPRTKNTKFVTLIERGGRVRSRKLTYAKGPIASEVRKALRDNVDVASTLHTDGARMHEFTLAVAKHEAMNHREERAGVAALIGWPSYPSQLGQLADAAGKASDGLTCGFLRLRLAD